MNRKRYLLRCLLLTILSGLLIFWSEKFRGWNWHNGSPPPWQVFNALNLPAVTVGHQLFLKPFPSVFRLAGDYTYLAFVFGQWWWVREWWLATKKEQTRPWFMALSVAISCVLLVEAKHVYHTITFWPAMLTMSGNSLAHWHQMFPLTKHVVGPAIFAAVAVPIAYLGWVTYVTLTTGRLLVQVAAAPKNELWLVRLWFVGLLGIIAFDIGNGLSGWDFVHLQMTYIMLIMPVVWLVLGILLWSVIRYRKRLAGHA